MQTTATQTDRSPNSRHWQEESQRAATVLSKMLDWKEYDAFFATLDGHSHRDLTKACEDKIAQLRKPRVVRQYSRRQITIGQDDRGNNITLMENVDGTWTNLYAEIIVPADFVQRHFSHLLRTV